MTDSNYKAIATLLEEQANLYNEGRDSRTSNDRRMEIDFDLVEVRDNLLGKLIMFFYEKRDEEFENDMDKYFALTMEEDEVEEEVDPNIAGFFGSQDAKRSSERSEKIMATKKRKRQAKELEQNMDDEGIVNLTKQAENEQKLKDYYNHPNVKAALNGEKTPKQKSAKLQDFLKMEEVVKPPMSETFAKLLDNFDNYASQVEAGTFTVKFLVDAMKNDCPEMKDYKAGRKGLKAIKKDMMDIAEGYSI